MQRRIQTSGTEMAAKRLEDGSEYAEYDSDGDGVVTDEELQTSKELQELRLRHERADAQRAMSWFALWGTLQVYLQRFLGRKHGQIDQTVRIDRAFKHYGITTI
jgi:hypothetical protein